jgi:3-oxoacyl-[acyl-carrier protein] reductase
MAQTSADNGAGTVAQNVALVTGASRGIGRAVAGALLADGFSVALNGRDAERLAAVTADLESRFPGRTLAVPFDVSELAAQQEAVAKVVERFGRLDLVVANAGVGAFGPVDELDEATWRRVIDTNLTGVFFTVKAAAKALKDSGGMIVTIASLAGVNFFAGGAAYNASKFGLVGFSQAAMLDLREQGVRVSTILPGSVATEFNDRTVSDADAWKIQPQDIAETVLYLYRMPARTLPSKVEVRPTRPRRS